MGEKQTQQLIKHTCWGFEATLSLPEPSDIPLAVLREAQKEVP